MTGALLTLQAERFIVRTMTREGIEQSYSIHPREQDWGVCGEFVIIT